MRSTRSRLEKEENDGPRHTSRKYEHIRHAWEILYRKDVKAGFCVIIKFYTCEMTSKEKTSPRSSLLAESLRRAPLQDPHESIYCEYCRRIHMRGLTARLTEKRQKAEPKSKNKKKWTSSCGNPSYSVSNLAFECQQKGTARKRKIKLLSVGRLGPSIARSSPAQGAA